MTREITNQETGKLEASETVVPETQTQHPKLLLGQRSKFHVSSKYKDQDELETSNKEAKDSCSDAEINKGVIPTEFDLETSDIAESPSILSLKHRSQRHTQEEFSESPSILSGNKCVKKNNTEFNRDNDASSMSNNDEPNNVRLGTSLKEQEHDEDVNFNGDKNLEITRLPSCTKSADLSMECKENTPYNVNEDTYLDIENHTRSKFHHEHESTKSINVKSPVNPKALNMSHIKQTNKWGIEITTDVPSHISRAGSLKQGSIHTFLKPKSELKLNQSKRKRTAGSELDDEMRQAIELSKLEAEQNNTSGIEFSLNCTNNETILKANYDNEHRLNDTIGSTMGKINKRKSENNSDSETENDNKTPYMNAMDSFNYVPDTMMLGHEDEKGEKPKFKYVRSPIRKKADRLKLLQGHDCKECRDFYKGDNLSESQLANLLNKCSKHRSKEPPLQQSPQIRWNLEIEEDGPNDKTQISSPFKTRQRRKLLRKL